MKNIKIFVWFFIFLNLICLNLSSLRDPFYLPPRSVEKKVDYKINLDGIIKINDKYGAIISKGENKEVVFENQDVFGYKIKSITDSFVLILKGSKLKKLFIN